MSAITERDRPLSVRDREQIRNRLRMNEEALKGHIVVPTNDRIKEAGLDPRRKARLEQALRSDVQEDAGLLRAKIERDKRILAAGDPKNLDRKDRSRLSKQVKEDSAWIKAHMCPKKLFNVRRENPNFQRAVQACKVEHTDEYKAVASRLKENLRRIDPDGDSNLERLRPNS